MATTPSQSGGAQGDRPVLEVRGLEKSFRAGRALFGAAARHRALAGVSLAVARGEVLALVGESGSGKSTVARLVARLLRPDGGEIRLDGVDVLRAHRRGATLAYRKRVQMVFQDPFGSLNPVHTVLHHLARPLRRHGLARSDAEARSRAAALLERVGLSPAADYLDAYPSALSGGQRQRVAIARALAPEPDVLIADEPTSMLDVSLRTGVLNLLAELQRERGLAILLITHDLASARYLANRVAVLYRGEIVEQGPAEQILHTPEHPYTQTLLAAARRGAGSFGARAGAEPEAS